VIRESLFEIRYWIFVIRDVIMGETMQKKIYHRTLLLVSVLLAFLGACAQGEAVETDFNNSGKDSIEGKYEETDLSSGANNQGETLETDDVNIVRDKIEGKYEVSFFSRSSDESNHLVLMGYLTLSEGKYSFIREEVDNVPSFMDYLFFVRYPEGTYDLKIATTEPGDEELMEYDGITNIGGIVFSSKLEEGDIDIDNSFLLFSSEESEIIWLDDLPYWFSQLNVWFITKSWND